MKTFFNRHMWIFAILMLALAPQASAQAGLWIPAQPLSNGLGAWWNLRADGTLTRSWGALAQARYSFDGTILTVIPGGERKDRPRFRIRFEGDRMFSRSDELGAPETEYRRNGAAVDGAPLLGEWASVAAAHSDSSHGMEDMPGMTGAPKDIPSVRTFTADGVYKVRIAYTTQRGNWNASASSIRLEGETELHFTLDEKMLVIADVIYIAN
jgi:hypothetical protein